jgi:hypothetical protein
VTEWKSDYPWLQLAFKHVGRSGRKASEDWRVRIEDELDATLDYKVRPDGTTTVWCGMSSHDFHHEPTPKELLEGLADAYRQEVIRLDVRLGPVAVATREGPVQLSEAACTVLVAEIRSRDGDDDVSRALATGGDSEPVELDREGKIVVFDALWSLADRSGVEDPLDPMLGLLRERLKDEIAEGPAPNA